MRPTANESLYRDLEMRHGSNLSSRRLPGNMAIRPLTLDDVDAVLELEKDSFPPQERATREKIEYRLRVCPELSAGLFARSFDWDPKEAKDVFGVAAAGRTPVKETLVAHIIGTKMASNVVTDEAMELPELDANFERKDPADPRGHIETGSSIGVHSVAVDENHRSMGLGYNLVCDYVQKLYSLSTADRIAILAHKELLPFYELNGFEDRGESACKFGGEVWHDLVLPFDAYDDRLIE